MSEHSESQYRPDVRRLGIRFFRLVLRPILGKPVHDPTSGFVGVNRSALGVFSRSFPLEYPEIEALVVLQRRRFRFEEVPCKMRPRCYRPLFHHRLEVALLYYSRAAGSFRQRAEIRTQAAPARTGSAPPRRTGKGE